ncbi:hypothetical protein M426DRAFT_220977 [Hypoxylon sp. CI-4A]|nr:hypothetical protein M426DRAFT_220977 [Hypoxylon sp. CI-4A]
MKVVTACLNCFPRKYTPARTYPDFLSIPYKTNGGLNNENYLPGNPPQRSGRAENDPEGVISKQPRRPRSLYLNADATPRLDSPRLGPAMTGREDYPHEDPREDWSKVTLTATQIAELFRTIHSALEHVPYAIGGMAALYAHGCTDRRVKSVSLICPAHAKYNVRAWLASRGFEGYADSVGIPISGGPDGVFTCRARIKYLDEGFEKFERVQSSSMGKAWILGLASQLDHAAAGFVDHYRKMQRRLSRENDGRGKGTGQEEGALRAIARDIFWLLDKAAETEHPLPRHLLPTLLSEECWVPFTDRNAEARKEMARAGIDVNAVETRHSNEAMIREHTAILAQYGLENDETEEEQPFDMMRTLTNKKSVYTLRPGPITPSKPSADVLPLPTLILTTPSTPPKKRPSTSSSGKKKTSFFSGLLHSRKSDGSPRSRSFRDFGRSLTRTSTSKSAPTTRPPPARCSSETERPNADWV